MFGMTNRDNVFNCCLHNFHVLIESGIYLFFSWCVHCHVLVSGECCHYSTSSCPGGGSTLKLDSTFTIFGDVSRCIYFFWNETILFPIRTIFSLNISK